ncbi:MAG: class I SAM-dependent methyltransferase [Actinomycetota bacterium]
MDEHHLTRDEQFDLELLYDAVWYQQWVLEALGPIEGVVAEVGAGNGNFTRWIAMRAKRVLAVEPHDELADRIERHKIPGVELVRSRVEDLAGVVEADMAVSINVLEHIDDDVSALRAIKALVKPGGKIAILVPAHQALFGELDKRYHHIRRYSKRMVRDRLGLAGIEVERVRYFNPLGAIGWLVFVRLLGRTRLSRSSVRLSERIAVPLGRSLELLGFHPFGQSVVGIGRRPVSD